MELIEMNWMFAYCNPQIIDYEMESDLNKQSKRFNEVAVLMDEF